jgi:hypothetical protein
VVRVRVRVRVRGQGQGLEFRVRVRVKLAFPYNAPYVHQSGDTQILEPFQLFRDDIEQRRSKLESFNGGLIGHSLPARHILHCKCEPDRRTMRKKGRIRFVRSRRHFYTHDGENKQQTQKEDGKHTAK